MCLYHNRIECRCIEVGLTVDEETECDSDDANVDVDALSESGEESEEHDSDAFVSIRKTTMMMLITLTCPLRS
jgi:hypothetical protein